MTDAIQWSRQQLAAQEKFAAWRVAWRQGRAPQLFKLAGYAGTGKTTLARYLGGSAAAYMTYTAKAAIVLRQKGCLGAKNIDQWLYRPRLGSGCSAASYSATSSCLPAKRFRSPTAVLIGRIKNWNASSRRLRNCFGRT
jgi:hypothetical protein